LSHDDGGLHISDQMLATITDLRAFLFENVYRCAQVDSEFQKAGLVIRHLYAHLLEFGLIRREGREWRREERPASWRDGTTAHREVCDFIAGMTDRYALDLYEHIFLPHPWNLR